jgi:hypothetical protein
MSNKFLRQAAGGWADGRMTDGFGMTSSEIEGRHQQLFIFDPRAVPAGPGPRRPRFALRFLMGLAVVPLGVAGRVMAEIYLELTRDAVHYQGVFAFVAITHLVLVIATAVALLSFRRRPLVVAFTVQLWIGYGIGAALLALKDLG